MISMPPWIAIEEVPSKALLTPEEEFCYSHFKTTHTRNSDGPFVVRLPFKDKPDHSDTRGIAEASFTRFKCQPEVSEAYRKFVDEYIQLNHMAKVPEDKVIYSSTSYLPHHPVFKRDIPKKIFSASQNFRRISLNSLLHTGPKLQDVLVIILRWSFFAVVFSCDIGKMFRQFLVHEQDWDWPRIVWHFAETDPVQTFWLLTVTYRTVLGPFCLMLACFSWQMMRGKIS